MFACTVLTFMQHVSAEMDNLAIKTNKNCFVRIKQLQSSFRFFKMLATDSQRWQNICLNSQLLQERS